jgi:hypothetical protein
MKTKIEFAATIEGEGITGEVLWDYFLKCADAKGWNLTLTTMLGHEENHEN